MRLTRLDIGQLRCLERVEFRPAPGLNLITGANGAGKTSLIEAVHLLGYGRSFRGRVRDGLIRSGSPHLELYAEWLDGAFPLVAHPRRMHLAVPLPGSVRKTAYGAMAAFSAPISLTGGSPVDGRPRGSTADT